MPATSPKPDATAHTWLNRFDLLVRICAQKWPALRSDLDDVLVLARQLAEIAPQAVAIVLPAAEGLRSPGMDTGRSIGSHADPTAAVVISALDGRGRDESKAHDRWRQGDAGANLAHLCLVTLARQTNPDMARRNVRGARDHLLTAIGAYHRTMGSTEADEPDDTEGDQGCKSCRRVKRSNGKGWLWNEMFRDGLCQWCRREAVANQKAWTDKHPGEQPAVVGSKLWWPNERLIEWRRDNGDKHMTPAVRQRLEKTKPKRRRAS